MINCPLCKGTGKIKEPAFTFANKQADVIRRKKVAKALQKKGYTVREIMKQMGYKHPGSISFLLK